MKGFSEKNGTADFTLLQSIIKAPATSHKVAVSKIDA
jgi:hypothetical protein